LFVINCNEIPWWKNKWQRNKVAAIQRRTTTFFPGNVSSTGYSDGRAVSITSSISVKRGYLCCLNAEMQKAAAAFKGKL
jgi:hypothetical protein